MKSKNQSRTTQSQQNKGNTMSNQNEATNQNQAPTNNNVETPNVDTPKTEAPKAETPKVEAKKNFNEIYKDLPRWSKILLSLVVITAIYKFVPIVELLTLFFWAVMVPVVFLFMLGVISNETYDSICDGISGIKSAVKTKLEEEAKAAPQN